MPHHSLAPVIQLHADEILNIEYHIKRLMLRALNKGGTREKVAARLGMHERNLQRLIKLYGIKKVSGVYIIEKSTLIVAYIEPIF